MSPPKNVIESIAISAAVDIVNRMQDMESGALDRGPRNGLSAHLGGDVIRQGRPRSPGSGGASPYQRRRGPIDRSFESTTMHVAIGRLRGDVSLGRGRPPIRRSRPLRDILLKISPSLRRTKNDSPRCESRALRFLSPCIPRPRHVFVKRRRSGSIRQC
jgi:hypothetical protein